jgi:transketolase
MSSQNAALSTATSTVTHKDMANAISALSMDAVQKANSGHPGMPMGMADVATVLFSKFLKFDASKPHWSDRDRFILSAGHGSMLLYSLLYLTGYEDITLDDIKDFRQLGSKTCGHPEYEELAGIETTTGPLGQGIANAVGMAMAEKIQAARFGDSIVDHYTYAIAGDGCLMEGISHEAISLAGTLELSKLIILFDDNHICIDGPTELTVNDDQPARFAACGWHVQAVDGHDPQAIEDAIRDAKASDKPSLIACRTQIAKGAPTKEGKNSSHGAPLGADEIKGARANIGWGYGDFEIPDDILAAWRAAGSRGAADSESWDTRLNESNQKTEFERVDSGTLPADFDKAVAEVKKAFAESSPMATRKSSGVALETLCKALPEMIGGSADLTGSNLTKTSYMQPISKEDFSGSYVYYGVREHAMCSAMNGMTLHGGVIPFGGTFFVFTDYCRPAIRLAALMKQRAIYVMTHDSIGLGEDGPTHQPVEHLASLRAMPNLYVFRPCDANEVAECWELSIRKEDAPSMLVLTRQNVPNTRNAYEAENLCAKGAYVLAEADGEAKTVIIATGSEVELALKAKEELDAAGIATRVVSMPCDRLFNEQSAEYQEYVLGGESVVRVAVEAACAFGWERYIGRNGIFIGMQDTFGASAPADQLYKHFGITVENLVEQVKARF